MPPPPPSPAPSYGPSSPAAPAAPTSGSVAVAPPARTVVEVVAKRGGVGQALVFVLTVGLVAAAFVVGIVFGAIAALAPQEGRGLPLESEVRSGGSDVIAVISIEGTIDAPSAEEVERAVGHVLATPAIRGVVLRVDSPGGAVSPSDRIWRQIERLRTGGVPVVASYGGVAASGGVYVSCGADHIVCEPTTTTGSVGVIASVMTFGGLMEKVGVRPVTLVASGSPRKDDANDVYRTWDETDRAVVQTMLDRSYDLFVQRVMAGRGPKSPDAARLRSVLDGRIFDAEDAKDVGLVDSIGYLDDAIAEVERRLGLAAGSARVVRLFEPASLFGSGLLGMSTRASTLDRVIGAVRGTGGAPAAEGADAERLRSLVTDLTATRVEYRWNQ